MRFILLLFVAIIFFLFCLGALTGGQEEDIISESARDFPPDFNSNSTSRWRNLPDSQPATKQFRRRGRGIARTSGEWVGYAQRELGILVRRAADGFNHFTEGYNDARQNIHDSKQPLNQDLPPPPPIQEVAPIYRLEMYEQERESDEVENDDNPGARSRLRRSYVPE